MMSWIRGPIGIGAQPVLGRVVGATPAGWIAHGLGAYRLPGLHLQSGPAQPAGQLARGNGNHGPVAGVTDFDSNKDAGSLVRRLPVRCEPFGELLGTELQSVALTARQPQHYVLQITRLVWHCHLLMKSRVL
jgi:hypothetical protein